MCRPFTKSHTGQQPQSRSHKPPAIYRMPTVTLRASVALSGLFMTDPPVPCGVQEFRRV